MKWKEKLEHYPLPGWLFVFFMAVYNEVMLHLWIMEEANGGRMLAVTAFAIGFGAVLAALVSLLPPKASKWTAVGVSIAITVFWLVEYFVSDAYQVFMTPSTIVGGAGGVAQDYFDLVVSLVVRNLWRIGMMLLPVALYGIFCYSPEIEFRKPWKYLAAGAAVSYLLGVGAVNFLTADADRFGMAYNFDSVVRCFGLHMALTLETTQGNPAAEEPSFVVMESLPVPTEAETQPQGETQTAAEETEDPLETTVPLEEYGYNTMEKLDFAALAESEKHKGAAALHQYIAAQTPSQKNAYTGLFAGKNLILITAEAFAAEIIDPELTPTLYRLANKGIRFTEYYQPAWGASTTSGEFSNVVGLVPTTGGSCMKEAIEQDLFLTMGHQLQNLGYSSAAYHNHHATFYDRNKTHVHLGYDKFEAMFGGLEGVKAVWPESDLELMEATVPQYIDQQPFSVYYMTVSGHCIYTYDENVQTQKHYDKVKDLPYSETVKCFLAAQLELEAAMASLVGQLEEAGIADDTVIVMATDHYPYGLERSGTWRNSEDYLAELYGVESYDGFMRDHNALIIWSGCIEDRNIVVDEPVYSLDILPTLSNLFGVEFDSRLLVGRDVFSDADPLVLWPNHCWITDKGRYDAIEGVFTPAEGVQVPEGYREYISSVVANKITYSASVLNLNYFNFLSDILGRE